MTPRLRSALPAAVLTVAALAAPSAASHAEPPALAGRTVVTASRAGATVVRVAHSVVVPRNAVTVTGGGSMVAFALVPDEETAGAALLAVRLPRELNQPLFVSGDTDRAGGMVLRRGTYTMHLAPGEKPATVMLRLPGVAGTRRFTPATRVRSGMRPLATSVTSSAGGVTYGAGQDVTLNAPGLLVSGVVGMRSGSSPFDEIGACHYADASRFVPADLRWTPFCPGASGASGGTVDLFQTTAKGDRFGAIGLAEVADGSQAYGVWLASPGRVEKVTSFGFFLEYAE